MTAWQPLRATRRTRAPSPRDPRSAGSRAGDEAPGYFPHQSSTCQSPGAQHGDRELAVAGGRCSSEERSPTKPGTVGKHSEPSTPFTFMSSMRASTSKQPGTQLRQRGRLHAVLLRWTPGDGVQPDVRDLLALEDPEVGAVRRGDEARRGPSCAGRCRCHIIGRLALMAVDAHQDHVVHPHCCLGTVPSRDCRYTSTEVRFSTRVRDVSVDPARRGVPSGADADDSGGGRGERRGARRDRLGRRGERRTTYRELGDLVATATRAMIAAGVAPGDHVAVWAPNGLAWIVAALGAQSAGAALVPVNPRAKGRGGGVRSSRASKGRAARHDDRVPRHRHGRDARRTAGRCRTCAASCCSTARRGHPRRRRASMSRRRGESCRARRACRTTKRRRARSAVRPSDASDVLFTSARPGVRRAWS